MSSQLQDALGMFAFLAIELSVFLTTIVYAKLKKLFTYTHVCMYVLSDFSVSKSTRKIPTRI